jgi:hypothetical protein
MLSFEKLTELLPQSDSVNKMLETPLVAFLPIHTRSYYYTQLSFNYRLNC